MKNKSLLALALLVVVLGAGATVAQELRTATPKKPRAELATPEEEEALLGLTREAEQLGADEASLTKLAAIQARANRIVKRFRLRAHVKASECVSYQPPQPAFWTVSDPAPVSSKTEGVASVGSSP